MNAFDPNSMVNAMNAYNQIVGNNRSFSGSLNNPSGLRSADRIDEWNASRGFRGLNSAGQQIWGAPTSTRRPVVNTPATNPYSAVGQGLSLTEVNKLVQQSIADALRKGQASESIALMNQFLQYNDLGGVASRAADMFYQGKSYAEVYTTITGTQEYNDRFPGLAQLRKKGIAIDEAKYNEQMNTYENIFKRAGLDNYADFKSNKNTYANFLINDISPDELKARVNTATSFVNNADSTITEMFQKYYGINKKDLVAYYLDPETSITQLQRKTEAAQLGTSAANVGLDVGSAYAESLSARAGDARSTGINVANITSAITAAGAAKEEYAKLAGISGDALTTKDLIESKLNDVNAAKKVSGLASQERARFSGKSAGTAVTGSNLSGSF
jgi:hypothetical protein